MFKANDSSQGFGGIFMQSILNHLKPIELISKEQLAAYNRTWNIFTQIIELENKVKSSLAKSKNSLPNEHLQTELAKMRNYVLIETRDANNEPKHKIVLSYGAQSSEIVNEISRIKAVLDYYLVKEQVALKTALSSQQQQLKTEALLNQLKSDLIDRICHYKGDIEECVKKCFNELKIHLNQNKK